MQKKENKPSRNHRHLHHRLWLDLLHQNDLHLLLLGHLLHLNRVSLIQIHHKSLQAQNQHHQEGKTARMDTKLRSKLHIKGKSSSKPVTWQSSEGSSSTQASSPQQQKDITEQLQNQSVKPSITLPEGWICVWSKSQKRWYFFDTSTNKSVWDPRLIGM